MIIRNLVPWAGPRFAYEIGDSVEVSDEVGAARIAAGLAEDFDGDREVEVHRHESAAPAEKAK